MGRQGFGENMEDYFEFLSLVKSLNGLFVKLLPYKYKSKIIKVCHPTDTYAWLIDRILILSISPSSSLEPCNLRVTASDQFQKKSLDTDYTLARLWWGLTRSLFDRITGPRWPPAPLPARRAYRPEGRAYASESATSVQCI